MEIISARQVPYWVVRDGDDVVVDIFDIGYKHQAELLQRDYGKEYGDTFTIHLEYRAIEE